MAGKPRFRVQGDLFDDDLDGDLDDDECQPGPNYLAQFRKPMTEEELDEAARELEQAIMAALDEIERM